MKQPTTFFARVIRIGILGWVLSTYESLSGVIRTARRSPCFRHTSPAATLRMPSPEISGDSLFSSTGGRTGTDCSLANEATRNAALDVEI